MDFYVPTRELEDFTAVLTAEGITPEVTDKTFSLTWEGKETLEARLVRAEVLETDVPVFYDVDPVTSRRAFRLPSGKKFIITDLDGNFLRLVEPPPGWER